MSELFAQGSTIGCGSRLNNFVKEVTHLVLFSSKD